MEESGISDHDELLFEAEDEDIAMDLEAPSDESSDEFPFNFDDATELLYVKMSKSDQRRFLKDLNYDIQDTIYRSSLSAKELFPKDFEAIFPNSPMSLFRYLGKMSRYRQSGESKVSLMKRCADSREEHGKEVSRLPTPQTLISGMKERLLLRPFQFFGCTNGSLYD